MLALKVPLKDAAKTKADLQKRGLLLDGYKLGKADGHLYFPLVERFDTPYSIEERDLKPYANQPTTLKDALQGKLPPEVLERLKTAYDQVGDIAILEVDDEFKAYDTIIGETLLATNKLIKTALAKETGHEGTFRTQKMRLLAGEDKRDTHHKENGVRLHIDVEEVYYSARLSTERKRVMQLVKPGERVLVMFSGAGPYTCVLAKNTDAKEVIGVEINPAGHDLAVENIKKNKLQHTTTYCGDVREVVPGLTQKTGLFDRILMPLPKSAETFLDVALAAAAPDATIHFYAFLHEDVHLQTHSWIKDACTAAGKACRIQATVKCGQQAPGVFRWCVDFSV